MRNEPRKGRKQRGSVLLLALFFLFALFLMAIAFFRLLPTELHSAARSSRAVKAHYAADAGVREAVAWLQSQPAGVQTAPVDDFNDVNDVWSDNMIDETWGYTTSIEVTNAPIKVYTITGTSFRDGRPVREITAMVQNQSFAKYALFIDTWGTGQTGDPLMFAMGSEGITGPIHTNDHFVIQVPDSGIWGDGKESWITGIRDPQGNLIEPAKMTQAGNFDISDNTLDVAGDGLAYDGGNFNGSDLGLIPYNDSGAPIASRYERFIEGGRERISQVNPIELPTENDEIRVKAWDGSDNPDLSDLPNATGVYVNTTSGPNDPSGNVEGGIFIKGSGQMTLSIAPGENQKIQMQQGKTDGEVTAYRKLITPPDKTVAIKDCVGWKQKTKYKNVKKTRTVTKANASKCGTETKTVKGEGGIITKIDVPKTCTYQETYYEKVPNGTKTVCAKKEITGYKNVPQDPYYTDVDASEPGAEKYTKTVDVTNVTSVIEVNEGDFTFEYDPDRMPDGITINGTTYDETSISGAAGIKGVTANSDGTFTVAVDQGSNGRTVVIEKDATTTVDGQKRYFGEFSILEGRTNGVVFSDDNIWDLRGVNKGAKHEGSDGILKYRGRTIAANLSGGGIIEIEEDILQYYGGNEQNSAGEDLNDGNNRLVVGNGSPTEEHILGLIGRDVYIDVESNSSNFAADKNPLEVYAVIMAGKKNPDGSVTGGFGVRDNDMDKNDGLGLLELYGGIITGIGKTTQTPHQKGGGFVTSGFGLDLNYDYMAAQNLEDFPTTQTFTVLRYVERFVGDS